MANRLSREKFFEETVGNLESGLNGLPISPDQITQVLSLVLQAQEAVANYYLGRAGVGTTSEQQLAGNMLAPLREVNLRLASPSEDKS